MTFFVYQFCIFFEHLIAALFCGLLKKMDSTWIVSVLLALTSHLVSTYAV